MYSKQSLKRISSRTVHNANLMKTRKAITYPRSVAWNKLTDAIKEAQSLNVFKAKLKAYLVENNEAHIDL